MRLSDAALEALLRRTGGWPVGLVLAALSLREHDDPDRAAAHFGGDDRLVADYVRDEMLSHLSADAAAFALRTSVLAELSGPLCDAALARRGSGRLLRDLARSNLLVTRLDNADHRYRYHPLLADMLRAELALDDAEAERDVHRRASRWYADRGELDPAAEHAIAGGGRERAVELMWELVPGHFGRGDHAALDAWVARFRPHEARTHPPLALTAAAAALLRGDRDAAERWTEVAETGLRRVQPAGRRALEGSAAAIRGGIGRGGLAGMRDAAQRVCRMVEPDSVWRAFARFLTGVACHLTGDRGRAATELAAAAALASETAPLVEALCLGQLALLALEGEDWEEGVALTARALDRFPDAGTAPALVLVPSALGRALGGDAAGAHDHAAHARRRLARRDGDAPWYEAETRIFLARAELRLSDAEAARGLLAGASRALRGLPDAPVLHDWIDAAWEQADVFAAGGIGSTTLTPAELRVLRFLPSHLAFREIATVLHVSTNTVKSQAHAVYRKLGAGSRSEAVARARSIGLVGA